MSNEIATAPDWAKNWLRANTKLWDDDHLLYQNILRVANTIDGCQVLYHDLYANLAGVREANLIGTSKEPTDDCKRILGLDHKVDVEEFRNACLTTPDLNPVDYLNALGRRYDVFVTDQMRQSFKRRVMDEQNLLYVLVEVESVLAGLSHRFRQGLITDSWPFPVGTLLRKGKIDKYFEHTIISSELGICKGDGSQIYEIAAAAMGVPGWKICMFGDNPYKDGKPALEVGYKFVLVDRECKHVDHDGNFKDPEVASWRIPVIRSYQHIPYDLEKVGSHRTSNEVSGL